MTPIAKFLADIPADRRKEMSRVLAVMRENLPAGYEEAFGKGMITWHVPLSRGPETYNGQPIMYAALASQKNYMALYLMSAYLSAESERALREGFKAAGKKLDMGKSCVRFKAADDLALDVIGKSVARFPVDEWIELNESARSAPKRMRS